MGSSFSNHTDRCSLERCSVIPKAIRAKAEEANTFPDALHSKQKQRNQRSLIIGTLAQCVAGQHLKQTFVCVHHKSAKYGELSPRICFWEDIAMSHPGVYLRDPTLTLSGLYQVVRPVPCRCSFLIELVNLLKPQGRSRVGLSDSDLGPPVP